MHKQTRGFKDERYVPNEVRGHAELGTTRRRDGTRGKLLITAGIS